MLDNRKEEIIEIANNLNWLLIPTNNKKPDSMLLQEIYGTSSWNQISKKQNNHSNRQLVIESANEFAVVTGKISNTISIDVDEKTNDIEKWLKETKVDFDGVLYQETRKGFHLFFEQGKKLKSAVNLNLNDLKTDIRGQGGYVVIFGDNYKEINNNYNVPSEYISEIFSELPDELINNLKRPDIVIEEEQNVSVDLESTKENEQVYTHAEASKRLDESRHSALIKSVLKKGFTNLKTGMRNTTYYTFSLLLKDIGFTKDEAIKMITPIIINKDKRETITSIISAYKDNKHAHMEYIKILYLANSWKFNSKKRNRFVNVAKSREERKYQNVNESYIDLLRNILNKGFKGTKKQLSKITKIPLRSLERILNSNTFTVETIKGRNGYTTVRYSVNVKKENYINYVVNSIEKVKQFISSSRQEFFETDELLLLGISSMMSGTLNKT